MISILGCSTVLLIFNFFFSFQTLGIVRVPLFTMGDGLRGFPAFLTNNFAGNARSELITGLLAAKLFTQEDMEKAVKASADFMKKNNNI